MRDFHMKPELYRWTCPTCLLVFRTRDYLYSIREARWHSWDQHRAYTPALPVPCLWDPRIQGRQILVTDQGDQEL